MTNQIIKKIAYFWLSGLLVFSPAIPVLASDHNEDNENEQEHSSSSRSEDDDETDNSSSFSEAISELIKKIDDAKNKLNSALTDAGGNQKKIREAQKEFRKDIREALKEFLEKIKDMRVSDQNDPPVANAQNVTAIEDTPKAIVLTGSDPEGSSLTYSVMSNPSHGALSGTAPNLTYTPALDYTGSDSFTFRVNDGSLNSATATVSITVQATNQAPTANTQSVSTTEDTPKAIVLTGTDPELASLTFSIVTNPSHGSLTGTVPNLTYTPALNYHGPDSFTFKVNDGGLDSTPALVSITVVAAP